jgi:hypothetical protein
MAARAAHRVRHEAISVVAILSLFVLVPSGWAQQAVRSKLDARKAYTFDRRRLFGTGGRSSLVTG